MGEATWTCGTHTLPQGPDQLLTERQLLVDGDPEGLPDVKVGRLAAVVAAAAHGLCQLRRAHADTLETRPRDGLLEAFDRRLELPARLVLVAI